MMGKRRARVGEKEGLDVLSAPITDGWEMQKEEKDSLITDNKKLPQQKTAVTNYKIMSTIDQLILLVAIGCILYFIWYNVR